jgi:hypothetical protein
MDEWVIWEKPPRGLKLLLLLALPFFSFVSFVKGASSPGLAHSAPLRVEDFSFVRNAPAEGFLCCLFSGHISLRDGGVVSRYININK